MRLELREWGFSLQLMCCLFSSRHLFIHQSTSHSGHIDDSLLIGLLGPFRLHSKIIQHGLESSRLFKSWIRIGFK